MAESRACDLTQGFWDLIKVTPEEITAVLDKREPKQSYPGPIGDFVANSSLAVTSHKRRNSRDASTLTFLPKWSRIVLT